MKKYEIKIEHRMSKDNLIVQAKEIGERIPKAPR
jgi:hypothetical protein